jgi:membrane associated rhomboid family serine protease
VGLYDRDYIREDDQPGSFFGGQHSMVVNLILLNVAILLVDVFAEGRFSRFLAVKGDLLHKPWNAWQLLTAGFAHSPHDVWHILANMFGLWMFGTDVEIIYGRKEFLRVYLTMIVFSSLAWVISVSALHGADERDTMIGASGAVMGITTLFALHYPLRPLYIWGIFPVPAWILCCLFIAADFLAATRRDDSVAHEAHLAGAGFAFVYYYLGWNFGRLLPSGWSLRGWKRRPKLRVHEPAAREENLTDEVDRILEKISREGEASLSAKERQTLEEASRRYQQRRQ